MKTLHLKKIPLGWALVALLLSGSAIAWRPERPQAKAGATKGAVASNGGASPGLGRGVEPVALGGGGVGASTFVAVRPVAAVAAAAEAEASAKSDLKPLWQLTVDPMPRSHRYRPLAKSPRVPRRSARVEIGAEWLAGAVVGGAMTADLGAGLQVRGTFKEVNRAVRDAPGLQTFSGILQEPAGKFSLERNPRGWAGTFWLTDSDEYVNLMPDRNEAGVTRLEVWPRTKAVCANTSEVTGDFYVAPPADPSIDHNMLESMPGADEVIYLDFNGEVVSGTQWNHFFNTWEDITVAPSGLNRDEIIAAWARVAEDFSTFNVNVTTRRSGFAHHAADPAGRRRLWRGYGYRHQLLDPRRGPHRWPSLQSSPRRESAQSRFRQTIRAAPGDQPE